MKMSRSSGLSTQDPLELVEGADDFQGVALHLDGFAHRVFVLKELFHHVGGDYGNVPAMQIVRLGEETAIAREKSWRWPDSWRPHP